MNTLVRLRDFPLLMILVVYLPAGILGLVSFQDKYALTFLCILLVFSVLYVCGFQFAVLVVARIREGVEGYELRRFFNGELILIFSVALYFLVTAYASFTSASVPLFVALAGGSEMDIADARAGFLSSREGAESLLRYVSFIASRSIIPIAILYLFSRGDSLRFVFLAMVIFCYSLTLEKVVPVFALLPLVLFYLFKKRYFYCLFSALSVVALIGLLSWTSYGGLARSDMGGSAVVLSGQRSGASMQFPEDVIIKGPVGDLERLYLKCLMPRFFSVQNDFDCFESTYTLDLVLIDRVLWVPYITAYDWLKFQDVGLDNRLTMGRSVSFVHHLFGEPKMQLEKIIYAYQRGPSPAGAGTANTLFLVDAKLAFGWVGVLLYSLIFIFCAASIFSSPSLVLKLASINPFLVAVVSPLTATLLSGGLAIFVLLSFLLPPDETYLKKQAAAYT